MKRTLVNRVGDLHKQKKLNNKIINLYPDQSRILVENPNLSASNALQRLTNHLLRTTKLAVIKGYELGLASNM